MVPISLAAVLALMYFYISTFRSTCAVPNMAVFCSSLSSRFLGVVLKYIIIIIIIIQLSSKPYVGVKSWSSLLRVLEALGYHAEMSCLLSWFETLRAFPKSFQSTVAVAICKVPRPTHFHTFPNSVSLHFPSTQRYGFNQKTRLSTSTLLTIQLIRVGYKYLIRTAQWTTCFSVTFATA
jgi:hypothetical protein